MLAKIRKKRKTFFNNNWILSVLWIIGTFIIIAFLLFTNWKISQKRSELKNKVTELEEKITILNEKNEELKNKQSQLNNEEYLEKIARDQLGLKKPNEEVIVIQNEKKEQNESENKKSTKNEGHWWDWLKSIWER